MNRFFVSEKQGNCFVLSKETLKHLKVIRAYDKPFICVYQEVFYKCVLENDLAKILEKIDENHEPQNDVVLALAVIKLDRFEWALQKAVELGATQIIPLRTQFTNHELISFNKFVKKYERFQTILQNASEQSFRNKIPELQELTDFKDAIKLQYTNKILAHEKVNLTQKLDQPIQGDTIFFVGPEGGFSDDEINLAIKNNIKLVSLGSRILRAETAAIFLLSQMKID
ncbi:16S rRNA (uracil(1498)-N(3))-methyltransferase [Mycoplasma nasistruthionis]|uniref:Ribosomal RNA small subunit methyltransferase E n=1 Tax=Mycoplasma nasistruthionis TaxID=353852 RepID=A0A5B7XVB9_9MOLU|nr:16S rRNA (uracil(1498)-N(3))-methyltransferase [Mycoplasma nasistruthionis]QCZ36798.1 16S rRNA (uracil(1498)-N(3))-methyltransferase [Mycoplasma nasistruthionis]